jgi:hypothetical protein
MAVNNMRNYPRFEPRSVKPKTIKLIFVVSLLSTQHREKKNKDWLAQNQNNVSEWSDMSTRKLLFQSASTINIQISMLV